MRRRELVGRKIVDAYFQRRRGGACLMWIELDNGSVVSFKVTRKGDGVAPSLWRGPKVRTLRPPWCEAE